MQQIKEKSLRSLMIVLIIGVLFFTGKALLAEEITLPGLPANHDVSNPQIFFNTLGTQSEQNSESGCASYEAGIRR